ncbi:MAG TPA: tetratricopeptide repeat protein, partial [Isosphaeraceae bacterium]|nr:tetratricopeptide repeat protein [Isosphaeraceae bacterium]
MIAARRKIGPRNYFIADALTLKADYIMATNPAEAEPLCLEATDLFLTRPELWCSSHTISVQNLLELSQRADTIEHSERLARLAVAAGDKLWDALPFVKMAAGEWLAICHARMGRNREAEEGYRQVLAARRASSDADAKRDLHNTLWNYADLLIRQGRYAEAEPLLRESIQLRGAKPFAGTSLKSEAEILLGRCVAARGRFAEAEPLLVGGLERIRRDRRVYPPFLMDTYNSVVAFYQAWGKPDRVALWRSRRIDALFVAKPFADRGF